MGFTGSRMVMSVCIDSRNILPDALFVPLAGEHVDGHSFIAQAIGNGAAAVFCAESVWREQGKAIVGQCERQNASCVVVADPLAALQRLAAYHLTKFPGLVRIGITGSSGKTTTKEILGTILSGYANTMVSSKNLNSEIGVPLQAFRVTKEHDYAVFEMGINHEGEMDTLADIVQPTFAVITNIGTAHIGLLGSRENIAMEKKKIVKHFSGAGTLFVHEQEPYLKLLTDSVRGEVIRYGPHSTKGFEGSRSMGLDGTVINWEGLQIRFPLFGTYNLQNALVCISVAAALGIPAETIRQGLESVQTIFGRSEIIQGEISILKDCYNANPDSVAKALNFLHEINWEGRKIAVLGGMLELGEESRFLHEQIGRLCGELSFHAVFFFGKEMKPAFSEFKNTGNKAFCEWFEDFDALFAAVSGYVQKHDLLLLKGSRGMAMERIADMIAGAKQ
ncbi:MAG: UDP-N-acetylmuramoyl-tripeptide--D-alanyl-D-alanine ligase [Spirochaetales bacterium]|nr:UDP-N-acetylmuramoyl-tripeptide--D-alanyl-D-alanine ligase [Spirochaetales bacterium]